METSIVSAESGLPVDDSFKEYYKQITMLDPNQIHWLVGDPERPKDTYILLIYDGVTSTDIGRDEIKMVVLPKFIYELYTDIITEIEPFCYYTYPEGERITGTSVSNSLYEHGKVDMGRDIEDRGFGVSKETVKRFIERVYELCSGKGPWNADLIYVPGGVDRDFARSAVACNLAKHTIDQMHEQTKSIFQKSNMPIYMK